MFDIRKFETVFKVVVGILHGAMMIANIFIGLHIDKTMSVSTLEDEIGVGGGLMVWGSFAILGSLILVGTEVYERQNTSGDIALVAAFQFMLLASVVSFWCYWL